MSDYQIEIPPSFQALHLDPRRRLTMPLRELRERYELCEDLAQQLVDHARSTLFALGIAEEDVLARCHRGLLEPQQLVGTDEAVWVTRRLAELLGWDWAGWSVEA
ncbi:MAG TPA: hypothetical protein VJ743_20490 [Albitalea sp.]|nr:hypothetical protein [Albitalea sp.]